ncbi:hypothetical protein [Actinophytocola oryzae]|uniref:Uncharacterized protein n=1 Tax=Actinophytocola oryzae TaxID=502181 RepID=A0A4R7W539_9PSEU|nr:hypothetical protein [Actinophytocola oryzae]TDV57846.1 hypothetical protein CLV71_101719 [Actinophytocola oryzae]
MNEFTMIQEHGPAPTPLTDDVLARARADLLTEIHATASTAPGRFRRRAVIIAATAAAAAAVAGVVATGGTDEPGLPPATDRAPALVEFHMPALPPALDPIPDGVVAPTFTGEHGWIAAVYKDADERRGEELSDIYVTAFTSRPDSRDAANREAVYDGKPAVVGKVDQQEPAYHDVSLTWERSPGQWVRITGMGDFADERTVRSLADTLVDTDERLSLDISVAPAGWELWGFKGAGPDGDGAVTSLRDPDNPDRAIDVSTMLGLVPDYGHAVEGGPRESVAVSVHGRPGDLVLVPGKRWMLQAPLPDGRAFQLQVPADFTRQQVVALAEGVS